MLRFLLFSIAVSSSFLSSSIFASASAVSSGQSALSLSSLCVASNATQCAELPATCLQCEDDDEQQQQPLSALLFNCSYGTRTEIRCVVKSDIPCAVRLVPPLLLCIRGGREKCAGT